MKTGNLEGNLLSFFVGLALGLDTEENSTFAPNWVCWDRGVSYRGQPFMPRGEDMQSFAIAQLWPHIMREHIDCVHHSGNYWVVRDGGQAFCVRDTIQGYGLVLVWRVFGAEVPDFYDCPRHGRIDLRPYNVPAGDLPDFRKATA